MQRNQNTTMRAAHRPLSRLTRGGIRILQSMIAIERLSKMFETARSTSHLALKDISLDVPEGQFVSILGPSGCGKSTLLYIVGGFVAPSQGGVRVKGAPVT